MNLALLNRPLRVWTWEDEESDILARQCLCCGERGHYQRQLEAHIAEHGLTWGVYVLPDGRVRDGHHTITAARRLGITHIRLETAEENTERWVRDHGHVSWAERSFGDQHLVR